jgi:signal transduction histidine kinase/CheY-like chemotaxis protein
MAGLVMAVLLVATVLAALTARRAVEASEAQLLRDRAGQVQSLLESVGTGFEAQLTSVAAIASVTDGDVEQFQRAVAGVESRSGGSSGAGWSMLRRSPAGFVEVSTAGLVTPLGNLPPAFSAGLEAASLGTFQVLGFLGSGLDRRFAMAIGAPGVAGDVIVYNETPLISATSNAASDDPDLLQGIAIEVFIGDRPDPDQLLIGIGTPTEDSEERALVQIAGAELLVEVSAPAPLGGDLANDLPWLLLLGGGLLGVSVAVAVELTQRRRDDAVAALGDLEAQNRLLDQALADQRAAEVARAQLEDQLRQSQRLEAIGHLAGGVAHDFNNVLAAIFSYADLALDGVTDPAARSDLEAIRAAARRGAGLTRQLLQFSRRDPGEVAVVDLNERISDVAGMLERTLGEDKALRCDLSSDPVPVLANPVELDQILLNLIVNARDAVDPGGTIGLRTDSVLLDRGDLATYPVLRPGPHVRLTVTDDGSGMVPEVLDHAFEPFFTTKGRGQGTGLGLSTVYGIVQRLGGHVAARSSAGEGTTIEVLVPAATSDAGGDPGEAVDEAPALPRSGRVLVVEDEEPLRRAMVRMLERAGFEVLEAADGEAALAHAGDPVDLLLTDVVMPGALTGVDVAAGLRERKEDLPVVYMTGHSDALLEGITVDGTGGTSLLAKPFSEQELLALVAAALGALR